MDLETNLVQPSLLQNGEMELQRQKMPTPDHTAPLAEPGMGPTLREPWPVWGTDSLWGIQASAGFQAQLKDKDWKEGPPQQPVCPGTSRALHRGKRP